MALNKEALSEVVTELTQSLEIISRAFYMGEQEPDLQVGAWLEQHLLGFWEKGLSGPGATSWHSCPVPWQPGSAGLPSQPLCPQAPRAVHGAPEASVNIWGWDRGERHQHKPLQRPRWSRRISEVCTNEVLALTRLWHTAGPFLVPDKK